MTQPTRPYAAYTDDQLQGLLAQSDQMQPPSAAHRLKADASREIAYRKNNPPGAAPDPTQNEQVRNFLVKQAWAALTPDQQALVAAHGEAQTALSAATDALTAASTMAAATQQRFQSAVTAVQDAAQKATAVVDALPADQQTALADITDQVPGLVQQVTTLSASADQVATDATAAQTSLAAAGQQVSDAVTAAVAADTTDAPALTDGSTPDPATPVPAAE